MMVRPRQSKLYDYFRPQPECELKTEDEAAKQNALLGDETPETISDSHDSGSNGFSNEIGCPGRTIGHVEEIPNSDDEDEVFDEIEAALGELKSKKANPLSKPEIDRLIPIREQKYSFSLQRLSVLKDQLDAEQVQQDIAFEEITNQRSHLVSANLSSPVEALRDPSSRDKLPDSVVLPPTLEDLVDAPAVHVQFFGRALPIPAFNAATTQNALIPFSNELRSDGTMLHWSSLSRDQIRKVLQSQGALENMLQDFVEIKQKAPQVEEPNVNIDWSCLLRLLKMLAKNAYLICDDALLYISSLLCRMKLDKWILRQASLVTATDQLFSSCLEQLCGGSRVKLKESLSREYARPLYQAHLIVNLPANSDQSLNFRRGLAKLFLTRSFAFPEHPPSSGIFGQALVHWLQTTDINCVSTEDGFSTTVAFFKLLTTALGRSHVADTEDKKRHNELVTKVAALLKDLFDAAFSARGHERTKIDTRNEVDMLISRLKLDLKFDFAPHHPSHWTHFFQGSAIIT